MIGLALRGLGQRKLRSALTAIAVLLGVAMIAGTYVLTDQIRTRLRRDLQHSIYAGVDVEVEAQGRRSTSQFGAARPLDARLIDRRQARCPAWRRPRASSGAPGAPGGRRQVQGPQGDGGRSSSSRVDARAVRPDQQPGRPHAATLRRGRHARDGRRSRRPRARRPGRHRHARRASQPVTVVGIYDFGGVSSLGGTDDRVGAARRRPALVRPRGRGHDDHRRRRGGRVARGARAAHRARRAATEVEVSTGDDSAEETADEINEHRRLPDAGAAGVRRRGAARGRVHHLQHVLDHRRGAHARVRAAAHARRDAAADPGRGGHRGARHRRGRVRAGPRARAGVREGAGRACSRRSGSACRPAAAELRHAHDRGRADRRDRRDAWWPRSARRCARPACRRSPRSQGERRAGPPAPLGALHRRDRCRARRRCCWSPGCSRGGPAASRLSTMAGGVVLLFIGVALSARWFVRPLAGRRGLAARAPVRRAGPARARERDAQPRPHRDDGRRADGRPRAGRLRRRLRQRHQGARSTRSIEQVVGADLVVRSDTMQPIPAGAGSVVAAHARRQRRARACCIDSVAVDGKQSSTPSPTS